MHKKIYTRTVGVLLSEEIYQELKSITDYLENSISESIRKMFEKKIDHLNFTKKNSGGGNQIG